jgi:hypothetical protein
METEYNLMLDRIITFVSDRSGIEKSKLTENSLIEDEIGIAGLDTLTFYEEFFKDFEIDNPSDFNSHQYVTSENLQIGLIIKSIFSTKARQTLKTKSVSVRHLVDVALKRKWHDQ